MRSKFAFLAIVLVYCAPQTTPVVNVGGTSMNIPIASAVKTAEAAPVDPGLAKTKMDAAQAVFDSTLARYQTGAATIDEVGTWSERLFAAQREALSGSALSTAARERAAYMQKLESVAKLHVNAGAASPSDVDKARYFRANAELEASRL